MKFRHLRKRYKIGLNQLALKTGVSNSLISYMERGSRVPKANTLKKLSRGLPVSYNYLLNMAGYAPKMPTDADVVNSMARIPVIGEIHCGKPIDAPQNVSGYQPFPANLLNPGHKYFIMNCVGHSMEPQIIDGAKVLCKKQTVAEDGQIVAVEKFDDTDCTCALKRYHHKPTYISLTADNAEYSGTSIYINKSNAHNYRIVGVVSLILTKPHKPII